MDIGTEKETIVIEPLEVPVPGFAPPAPPDPQQIPTEAPPVEIPVEDPVLVPA